jgi:hypothetical protein
MIHMGNKESSPWQEIFKDYSRRTNSIGDFFLGGEANSIGDFFSWRRSKFHR